MNAKKILRHGHGLAGRTTHSATPVMQVVLKAPFSLFAVSGFIKASACSFFCHTFESITQADS
ncbi:MAG: hypothetical protein C0401_10415 [Anaerolinea sp.]|nr:hypothetical protein [Anaerolinea sp.]